MRGDVDASWTWDLGYVSSFRLKLFEASAPQIFFYFMMTVHAMDCSILSVKYGTQNHAHRPHDPVSPSSVVQQPMVGDVEPIGLHPALVLHGKVGAIDSTTNFSCGGAVLAADPYTSQAGAQCQQFQHRHADPGPRT